MIDLKTATNVITACLNGADYLRRYRWTKKNFVEFDYTSEDFSVTIYLRPVNDFRRFNATGIHALAETKTELINQLGNSIDQASRDNFFAIHLYCLPEAFLNRSNHKLDLA